MYHSVFVLVKLGTNILLCLKHSLYIANEIDGKEISSWKKIFIPWDVLL